MVEFEKSQSFINITISVKGKLVPRRLFKMLDKIKKNVMFYVLFHKMRLLLDSKNKQQYLDFIKELEKTRHMGLEYLAKKSLNSPYWDREIFRTNELYSHDIVLKKYANIPFDQPLSCIIEHGLVLTEHLVENPLTYPFAKSNVVMSQARKKYLEENGIDAHAIGPYIHYVDTIYNDSELRRMKEKLGKTLLFFPSHSTKDVSKKESYKYMSEIIDKLKKKHDFDSVLICGYFMDIQDNLFDYIDHNEGYLFVSAGDRRGPMFLNLIKTFISLSDIVASTTIGTQTGYAYLLGKPYWTIPNGNITDYYSGNQNCVQNEKSIVSKPLIGNHKISYFDLEKMFYSQTFSIDDDLFGIVSDLWGFNEIKSKKNMKVILTCKGSACVE
ncbi:MAG: hypothetical protein ACYC04_06205 [Sulfurovum sp.]